MHLLDPKTHLRAGSLTGWVVAGMIADFARAMGKFAKTDKIDAIVLRAYPISGATFRQTIKQHANSINAK